jgi:hypothetical protein
MKPVLFAISAAVVLAVIYYLAPYALALWLFVRAGL